MTMINLKTDRFGELLINENEIINFPYGIPGIPFERFIIRECLEPVKWLISVDDPDIAMLIVSPFKFFPTYGFELSDEITSVLQAEKEEDLEIYVSLLKYNDGVAANLKSPFVINKNKKIGAQILLEDERYQFKVPIKK
jgi:flagellar assembly factor FliW